METTSNAEILLSYLENQLPRYLEELRQLCAIECPTISKDGVDEAGAWVRNWIGNRGWEERLWFDSHVGDSLVATIPGGNPDGPLILLVAHLDTVYPVGIAAQRPVRTEGNRLIGPGTADNKSGLLSGLYAMAALQDSDLLGPLGGISLVCGGDEELKMHSSVALLQTLAGSYDIALVLEAARENGDIVSARKGSGHWVLEVHGHEAHAGVEPHRGANAILAIAQQIVALQALNGMRPGTTVNVGVVSGGTLHNVVPDYARAEIDVRVVLPEDVGPVGEAIGLITETPHVYGTDATLDGGWYAKPMSRTAAIESLADIAVSSASELGFSVRDAATGGVSYANVLAGLGLPVLDGLGPIGGLDHSPDEYILIDSIVPRTAMLGLLMLRYAEGV